MKILLVHSGNSVSDSSQYTFVYEQGEALKEIGIEVQYFKIKGKGVIGYLSNLNRFKELIKEFHPDIIHAHYGLCGLFSNLQRKVPVITTYHGSDINKTKAYCFSFVSIRLSAFNIFVSLKNSIKSKVKKNFSIIPCGVDIELFKPIEITNARDYFKFNWDDRIVLFAGAFDRIVKNPEFAKEVIAKINNDVHLIELKGYKRKEVSILLSSVDALLMTSFSEGSPQIVKEAMACNCPIVSVDVGDVRHIVGDSLECFVSSTYDSDLLSDKLNRILNNKQRSNGRKRILEFNLSNNSVAKQLLIIYNQVLERNK